MHLKKVDSKWALPFRHEQKVAFYVFTLGVGFFSYTPYSFAGGCGRTLNLCFHCFKSIVISVECFLFGTDCWRRWGRPRLLPWGCLMGLWVHGFPAQNYCCWRICRAILSPHHYVPLLVTFFLFPCHYPLPPCSSSKSPRPGPCVHSGLLIMG